MKRVFITDYITNPDIEAKVLGPEVEVICLNEENEDAFPDIIQSADGILVWHAHLTTKTFSKLTQCKGIVRYGVGYDGVDVLAAEAAGLHFANTPDYGVDEVADTAASMILSLVRRVNEYNWSCKSYLSGWQEHTLKGITRTNEHILGIVGMGRIGSAVGLRMKAFGMRVIFYDPYVVSGYEKTLGVERVDSLDELLDCSSIISLHTPLTSETKSMVNHDFVSKLQSGAILVNTARGEVVDNLDTLYQGMQSGQIGSLGLDVLPQEPPNNGEALLKIWKDHEDPISTRIIITPHTAYFSENAWVEMRVKAAQNIQRALKDMPLKNLISSP